jgi:hypothetical protein
MSDNGAATTARQRLTLAAVVVVRWSKDFNIIFIMFRFLKTRGINLYLFFQKKHGRLKFS